MAITMRQLRLFLALAGSGSVSAAARRLHVTQPTASMQLREISESVGTPLYELVSRRVQLTDAGRELARTAQSMLDEWEAFTQRIDAMKGLDRGRLKVAVVSTAEYFVPRLLGRYCQRHPGIEISLEVLNRDGVVQRMRDNLDDLYVMSMPPRDIEIEDTILMPNPLVLIAHASHPLARGRDIPIRSLRQERFIVRERGSGTRMATDLHLRQSRFSPGLLLELGSNEAIREAVRGKLGVAVLSAHALVGGHVSRDLSILDVAGFPIQSKWHLVTRKGKRLSPIAASFQEHLLAEVSSLKLPASAAAGPQAHVADRPASRVSAAPRGSSGGSDRSQSSRPARVPRKAQSR